MVGKGGERVQATVKEAGAVRAVVVASAAAGRGPPGRGTLSWEAAGGLFGLLHSLTAPVYRHASGLSRKGGGGLLPVRSNAAAT